MAFASCTITLLVRLRNILQSLYSYAEVVLVTESRMATVSTWPFAACAERARAFGFFWSWLVHIPLARSASAVRRLVKHDGVVSPLAGRKHDLGEVEINLICKLWYLVAMFGDKVEGGSTPYDTEGS